MNDIKWLLQRRPHATEAQREAFCERVSIMLESHVSPHAGVIQYYRGLALNKVDQHD